MKSSRPVRQKVQHAVAWFKFGFHWWQESSLDWASLRGKKLMVILIHKSTFICCAFLFLILLLHIQEGCSSFSLSWKHFMDGLLCLDPPPLNPPVSNCPTPQLSSPFQHNNSIAAPGASCHPEPSFVLLLLSLRDWMLALCNCIVSPSSSPLIVFLKLNEKDTMIDTCFRLSALYENLNLHHQHSLKPISFRVSALSVSGSTDLM